MATEKGNKVRVLVEFSTLLNLNETKNKIINAVQTAVPDVISLKADTFEIVVEPAKSE